MSKLPLCKVENYLLTKGDYVYILKIIRGLYVKHKNYTGLVCHVFVRVILIFSKVPLRMTISVTLTL